MLHAFGVGGRIMEFIWSTGKRIITRVIRRDGLQRHLASYYSLPSLLAKQDLGW